MKLGTVFDTMVKRPRRNRKSAAVRALTEETVLRAQDLVAPFFLVEGEGRREEIGTLPGVFRLSLDVLVREAEAMHAGGIQAIALFPSVEEKDAAGSYALREDGLVPVALRVLKREISSLCVITDIALDPFTSHGHDGVVDGEGRVINDNTVEMLAQMALLHAQSGADIVAPSDMMDGRVGAIRRYLDEGGMQETSILSYAAKYASALYGPYREAVHSKLAAGDKKSYQLNPANVREALLEARLDEEEGADMLMVKPALYYLDVIAKIREMTELPVCAYHVSGEYAMVMAAQERGMLDADRVFLEALTAIKRAGCDFIFTYAAARLLPKF